jgi:hypothetical protein
MLQHAGEQQPRPGKAAPAKPRGLFHTQPHEFFPAARNVDTMEFRATDRSLSDYGFGPL